MKQTICILILGASLLSATAQERRVRLIETEPEKGKRPASETASNLAPGHYTLTFSSMSFIADPKPQEEEITMPATLSTRESEITIETLDSAGNPIKMSGRIQGTSIYLWMSGVEEDKIVTYHLTGKVANDHTAMGQASIFGSHQIVGEGKWALRFSASHE